jgi:hypothetical protein
LNANASAAMSDASHRRVSRNASSTRPAGHRVREQIRGVVRGDRIGAEPLQRRRHGSRLSIVSDNANVPGIGANIGAFHHADVSGT